MTRRAAASVDVPVPDHTAPVPQAPNASHKPIQLVLFEDVEPQPATDPDAVPARDPKTDDALAPGVSRRPAAPLRDASRPSRAEVAPC